MLVFMQYPGMPTASCLHHGGEFRVTAIELANEPCEKKVRTSWSSFSSVWQGHKAMLVSRVTIAIRPPVGAVSALF